MFKRICMGLACLCLVAANATAGVIFLDADSAPTGLNLDTIPLVTAYGTITGTLEIGTATDTEFTAAGASGNSFDIINSSSAAEMVFDFDVDSLSFIFGGNAGVFDITAFDVSNNVVDSFFQELTSGGQFAGPTSLSGGGIRRIAWVDPGFKFAAIDNVTIYTEQVVPEPASFAIFATGLFGLVGVRRRRRA